MKRMQRLGWRSGSLFVILAVVVGLLLGFVIDKATSATVAQASLFTSSGLTEASSVDRNRAMPAPCGGPVKCSEVKKPAGGVKKMRAGKLGHLPAKLVYGKHNRKIILDKLMRKAASMRSARYVASPETAKYLDPTVSRKEMWRYFTNTDNCGFMWRKVNGDAMATCQHPMWPGNIVPKMTAKDVKVMLCSGGAGFALAGGGWAGGPWVWTGIGFGWAVCIWEPEITEWMTSH